MRDDDFRDDAQMAAHLSFGRQHIHGYSGRRIRRAQPELLFRWQTAPWGLIVSGFAGMAIAAFGVGAQLWFRNRLVTEFGYDGRALQFRTLGRAETARDLSEIAEVADGAGAEGRSDTRCGSEVEGRSTCSTACRIPWPRRSGYEAISGCSVPRRDSSSTPFVASALM